VALIGPVPPERGGATPGGVATHQAHLFDGLSSVDGVKPTLLPTNARAMRSTVSLRPFVRYALYLSRRRCAGSRRDILAQLLTYRRFLTAALPDVIHVQHPLERVSYLCMLRDVEPRLVKAPIVVTAHSFFGEHPDTLIQGTMRPNLAVAARVIAVSPHVAEQAAQLGVEPGRLRVIRSGVDTERFAPRDRADARRHLGLDDRKGLVLFVGNLEPRKQLDVLLKALPRVRQRGPQVYMAIVGTGASAGALDQTSRLQQLTHELGLQDVVRFVGRVSGDDLLQWYAAADVFALPSSSEAQGIVALEAMACGLPVVASAVGGLLGTVDDGKSGFLIPSGDSDALADRLCVLLTDAELRASMGSAARDKVEREFTWTNAIHATVEVYREVVCQKP
jgi:glycosyltransferase involved in cell wall biosynthesis